ncbi:RagB/SusD family nutrient uptake outer membrane protein [Mucilaginibacter ginkgonis]|uniref:RagB/SusD family nutrient uptake outer membrane protein n=1 Tax=Mucilaginibacter ginkgonis TaxID=2682091 RepID=A0A7T7JGT4_9SPHI|nr:RagB/SusD family nutrient uptake outer membrane protein [Mucilaginibacter ginkgonis]QQL49827.1 RagB/SusD family nutrient uptake outer membrane protein [Mucilaginibacter ginkgonis]
MNSKYFKNKKAIAAPMLALLLLAGSCKKFTDLQPNNQFSETSAFSSADRVSLAVTGVYSAMQAGAYTDGTNRGYPFGAANVCQGEARGEDFIAVPSFFLITYQGDYDATTANNTAMWTTLYAGINRANVVIKGVQGAVAAGTISAAVGAAYEGECRFLRALAYHELLIHFAKPYSDDPSALGVPLQLTAVTGSPDVPAASQVQRSTVAQCYTQILADLDFAETNLPAVPAIKITHASKGAAIALKTRIKLHMKDWAGVIAEGAKLGTGTVSATYTSPIGSYALTASPDGPFASVGANYSNPESIFSIENNTNRNSGTNGSISTMFTKAPGRGLMVISPIIYDAPFWTANDLRRTLLTTTDNRYWYTSKYKDPATFTDANPIIRYAEVLLNVAEAYSRTAALSANAFSLLNAVRNRSVTAAADRFASIASFATANDLTQAILNERRIEFLGEGRRWSDIHRLVTDPVFSTGGIPSKPSSANATFATYTIGKPYAGARSVAAIPYTGGAASYKFIWPIPVVETNANPVLAAQQNPGY